jgi:hypothetical protein
MAETIVACNFLVGGTLASDDANWPHIVGPLSCGY